MCILCAGAAAAAATGASQVPLAWARAATQVSPATPHIVAGFVRPIIVTVMGFNLYSYGVCVAAALLIALTVFGRELTKNGIKLDEMHCFFVFLFGFAVGSKGHLALSAFGAGEPLTWKAFDIRTGHSFMGSIIGATFCMLVFTRWHKVAILPFLDVLLPCCLLGHTVGKAGCFFSGDGCYGPPADPETVPWAMSFPNAADPTTIPVHPTPIYEGALSFIVFLLALILFPLPRPAGGDGRRTAFVLVLYGIERVCIEPFRRHPPIELFMGLTEYQALAVALLIVGGMIELYVSAKEKRATGEVEMEATSTDGDDKKKKTKGEKKKTK